MATRSTRDVPLTLSVSTLGTESVQALQKQVQQLAKEGGAAAPAFQQLSDEIARLGEQSQLVQVARALSEEIETLSDAQATAAARAKELSDELNRLQANTLALSDEERKAKESLQLAQRALFDKRQELATYKNETSSAEKETSRYTAEVRRMTAEIINGKTQLRDKTEAYRAARAATRDAADEESKFSRNVQQAARDVASGQKALADRTAELERTKQALRDSALAAESVADAEAKLFDAYNRTAEVIDDIRLANERLAESERQLAFEAQAAAASYVNWWQQALSQRDQAEQEAARRQAAAQEETSRRIIEAQRAADREEERLAIIQMNRRRELEAAAQAEADGIVRDYERMEQAARETAQATQQSANAMNDAFRTVGTQSVQDLQREIQNVRNALVLLRDSGTLTGKELEGAFASGERRIRELERQIRAATGQTTLLDRATAGLKSTFGQFAAAFGVVEVVERLGSAFIGANVQIERLRLGLGSIYKNSQTAEQQIGFLQRSANDAGVSIGAITDSFVKFTASTTAANIPIEQTNALFASITKAAGTLGLSGDKVNHMLDALSQIAAKGVVSMEELRQQLGDSLPGALSLTARGLDITEAELIKLVESGGLLARDLFPALTRSLQGMSGEINTLTAQWERFKNALTITAQSAGDSGWLDVMKGALVGLGTVLYPLGVGFNTIFEGIFTTVRMIGASIAALVNRDFSMLGDEVERLAEESFNRQAKVAESLRNISVFADRNAQSQANMASASNSAAGATQRVGTALGQAASSAGQVATAGNAAAAATTAAGNAAAGAEPKVNAVGQSWQRLSIDYKNATDVSALLITNAEKLARAKEIEGQATVTLSQLSGNELAVLQASAFATLNHANAIEEVVNRRQQELRDMALFQTALELESQRLGDPDGSRQAQIDKIGETIAARQAELEKAQQQMAELEAEAEQRTLAVQMYKDNSAAVDELRKALELSLVALEETVIAERDGRASKEDVERAATAAARAEGLFRDALEDGAKALERSNRALRDKSNLAQASANLDIARSRSSEALARALGNETLVVQEQINQKRIEISTIRAAMEAKVLEADATIKSTQAQLENLRALNDLSPEKEAELQSRINNAEAMKIEAKAMGENITILEQEIQTLRRNSEEHIRNQNIRNGLGGGGGGGGGKGGKGGKGGMPADTRYDSPLGNNKYARPAGGSIVGNTREDRLAGQNAVDNSLIFTLRDKMRMGTLTADDAAALQSAIAALDQNEQINRDLDRMNPGAFSSAGMADRNEWRNVRQQFAQQLTRLNGQGRVSRVEIKIGGQNKRINTLSDEDSDTLVETLKQLETASARAA